MRYELKTSLVYGKRPSGSKCAFIENLPPLSARDQDLRSIPPFGNGLAKPAVGAAAVIVCEVRS